MNENRDSRLPTGLIWLLFYHGILVLISLGYSVDAMVELLDSLSRGFAPEDVVIFSCVFLVLACWGMAMGIASLGMMGGSARGFLLGMICHLLLEIPALAMMLYLFGMSVLSLIGSKEWDGWASLALIFALMCLPFVLISAWAFFYLRRLRTRLLS
jgi:hypothetical protein